MRPVHRNLIGIGIGFLCAGATPAAEKPVVEEVKIASPVAALSGTLVIPPGRARTPCAVLLGGSLSHTRDGEMTRPGVPKRDALKRLADALLADGYASLRFDRVGFGASKPSAAWRGTYSDEAVAAAAVIRFARGRKEFDKIIVIGESAGAYVACLAAKAGATGDAYVFLGALCGPSESLYAYTFGGLVKWAESSPERLVWAKTTVRHELALGRTYKAMLAAAAKGDDTFPMVDGDYQARVGGLARRREEAKMPPDEMFRHVTAPALCLAGTRDLNTPLGHADAAVEAMRAAGNAAADAILIAGADHNFQTAPADPDVRMRERYTFQSFNRPYDPRLYKELGDWLKKTVGSIPQKGSCSCGVTGCG